jgi:hypothetical protein
MLAHTCGERGREIGDTTKERRKTERDRKIE